MDKKSKCKECSGVIKIKKIARYNDEKPRYKRPVRLLLLTLIFILVTIDV
jgi:hypothetical protein